MELPPQIKFRIYIISGYDQKVYGAISQKEGKSLYHPVRHPKK
jgi:hypothetical protein